MSKINTIPLINQNIFTSQLLDINNEQIVSDINLYGFPVNADCEEYGSVSRGFVQYEDTVVPVTPEFTKLEKLIVQIVYEVTNRKYKIDEIWAIKLMPGQSVIAHSHYKNHHTYPGDYFSIAYYPYAPLDSADLIFSAHWCGYMHNTISVKPQDGLLIIFNSFITHMTARQMIESPRIVVSMNLGPIEPRVNPNADWGIYMDRPIIESPVVKKTD
jgi:hypothetical protein